MHPGEGCGRLGPRPGRDLVARWTSHQEHASGHGSETIPLRCTALCRQLHGPVPRCATGIRAHLLASTGGPSPDLGPHGGPDRTGDEEGLAHGLDHALPIGVLSLLFGHLRAKHGALSPSIVAHALHNAVTVSLILSWPELLDLLYVR